MEAFQLSLGRAADFDLAKISFQDPDVQTGRTCSSTAPVPNAGGAVLSVIERGRAAGEPKNRNFNTNVENVHIRHTVFWTSRQDGALEQANNADGTFGNLSFNIASVVEAADTPPFFHNNVVNTLEGGGRLLYRTGFNDPRAAGGALQLRSDAIEQIADFMRA